MGSEDNHHHQTADSLTPADRRRRSIRLDDQIEEGLAPSTGTAAGARPPFHRRNRRCLLCCGTTTFILFLVILILALTVFKVKDPTIRMENLTIQGLALNSSGLLRTDVDVTLQADMAIKNPNAASFKFSNATTYLTYGGIDVGEARNPPGNARAGKTLRLNVTVELIVTRLSQVPGLVGDLQRREMTVGSETVIKGRVKILGFIKKHVEIGMNCTMVIDLNTQVVTPQHCDRDVKL